MYKEDEEICTGNRRVAPHKMVSPQQQQYDHPDGPWQTYSIWTYFTKTVI